MGRRLKNPYTIDELKIETATLDGRGIGRQEGRVVFVPDTVPGDVVAAHVYRKEKGSLVGKIEGLVAESADRVTPECNHFDTCRGCVWQQMSYDAQLRLKHDSVIETLKRIGNVEGQTVHPILGNETPFWYRNKLEFTFGARRYLLQSEIDSGEEIANQPALGYNVSGIYNKVLHVDQCLLQNEAVNEVRNAIWKFAVESEIPFYDERDHIGYLRNLVFRSTSRSGELMVMLVTAEGDHDQAASVFDYLKENFPAVTSAVHVINSKKNNAYYDQPWKYVYGPAFITENLGEWQFRVSPVSFFQTNSRQAERLYDVVRKFMGPGKVDLVYDLYCGAGSIGIYVSDLAEKIVGIEYSEDAVRDGEQNVGLNGLSNLEFFAGNMKELLNEDFIAAHGRPDIVITDPPRAGMDKPVVEQLMKLAPPKIVYVSCNPSTQARDLELMSGGYEVTDVQPVDMFPQTRHVENVALLRRK